MKFPMWNSPCGFARYLIAFRFDRFWVFFCLEIVEPIDRTHFFCSISINRSCITDLIKKNHALQVGSIDASRSTSSSSSSSATDSFPWLAVRWSKFEGGKAPQVGGLASIPALKS